MVSRRGSHQGETASLKIIGIFVVISDNEIGIVSKEAEKVFSSHCLD